MKTTIDMAGRVVVPKAIRTQLGLEAGQELEVRVVDGRLIEIEPVSVPVRLEERGGLPVLVAEGPVPTLTGDMVREAIERDREDREARWT